MIGSVYDGVYLQILYYAIIIIILFRQTLRNDKNVN